MTSLNSAIPVPPSSLKPDVAGTYVTFSRTPGAGQRRPVLENGREARCSMRVRRASIFCIHLGKSIGAGIAVSFIGVGGHALTTSGQNTRPWQEHLGRAADGWTGWGSALPLTPTPSNRDGVDGVGGVSVDALWTGL